MRHQLVPNVSQKHSCLALFIYLFIFENLLAAIFVLKSYSGKALIYLLAENDTTHDDDSICKMDQCIDCLFCEKLVR